MDEGHPITHSLTGEYMKRIALITTMAIALALTAGACKRGGGGDTTDNKGSTTPATKTAGGGMKGQKLYINNTCATCHGNDGKGDGPAGAALNPKPRNFRDVTAYKQGSKVEDIVETIKTGVPGTNMASFKHIAEGDRLLIAKYVIYLQKN